MPGPRHHWLRLAQILRAHLGHEALLDQREVEVVEAARQPRDEEAHKVAVAAPPPVLRGEADERDEEEVVELVVWLEVKVQEVVDVQDVDH